MNKEVRRPSAQGAADLITREVIRNRLNAIVEQQSLVLKNVSGSPLVAEANDCNTGLYLPDGQIVCMAPHNIFFSGAMEEVVKSIINVLGGGPSRWVGACGHVLDGGGMTPSSFCPAATQIYQEAFVCRR